MASVLLGFAVTLVTQLAKKLGIPAIVMLAACSLIGTFMFYGVEIMAGIYQWQSLAIFFTSVWGSATALYEVASKLLPKK